MSQHTIDLSDTAINTRLVRRGYYDEGMRVRQDVIVKSIATIRLCGMKEQKKASDSETSQLTVSHTKAAVLRACVCYKETIKKHQNNVRQCA